MNLKRKIVTDTKLKKCKNDTINKVKLLATKSSFELASMSPFRFPVPLDNFAHTIARYGGVLFMTIGAVTILFMASKLINFDGQFASSLSAIASVLEELVGIEKE